MCLENYILDKVVALLSLNIFDVKVCVRFIVFVWVFWYKYHFFLDFNKNALFQVRYPKFKIYIFVYCNAWENKENCYKCLQKDILSSLLSLTEDPLSTQEIIEFDFLLNQVVAWSFANARTSDSFVLEKSYTAENIS